MKINFFFKALKSVIVLTFILFSFTAIAQVNPVLYGMTTYGGADSAGTIFHLNADGTNMTKVHDFGSPKGNTPLGDLLLASDGNLYGLTSNGGVYNAGVLFSYDTATGVVTALHHFKPATGGFPFGSLIQAGNGKLYGMTNSGGINNFGVIFSFDYTTGTYTDLWNLTAHDGKYPYGNLMKASTNLLYGMTSNGGTDSVGTIFSFNITDTALIVLKNFDTLATGIGSGGQPRSSLIQASDGLLYGVARQNGANGWGTIFNLDPSNGTFTKLYDFTGVDGFYPTGSLIQGSDHLLYGMTQGFISEHSDGSIYSFNTVNLTFTNRYSFYVMHIGNPYGALHQLSDGTMYGMTYHGVTGSGDSSGALFNFYPSIDSISIVHQFNDSTGNYPEGSLIYLNNKFYGMTSGGGHNNSGTIFSYDSATNNYQDLFDFNGATDGFLPYGTLVKAGNGLLYGMTEYGGNQGLGTIFSVDPATDTYTSLYSFMGNAHGSYPSGSFLLASDGNLWGTTQYGGPPGFSSGILFVYGIADDSIIVKDHFPDIAGVPSSALIEATNGKLYGVTSGHGFGDFGQLYYVDLSAGFIHTLLLFSSTSIGYTWGSLVQGPNGKLYGMSDHGSIDDVGAIYSLNLADTSWSIIYHFSTMNGGNPYGNLLLANDGNMYGLTQFGGNHGYGTIFRLNPSDDSVHVEHSFSSQFPNEEYYPFGSLIQSRNGKLYGMTSQGPGTNGVGGILKYDIYSHTYSEIYTFNYADGANPTYNNFLEIGLDTSCFAYFDAYLSWTGPNNYSIVNLSTGSPVITYLWDFDDGNTSTSQYPQHVYTTTGNYNVCLTIQDGMGCHSTYCDSIHAADTINILSPVVAGIANVQKQGNVVTLYPNPFSNTCTIHFEGSNISNAELKVYDLLGQEVKSIYVGNNKQITLGRDNLSSGMYFYRLIQNKTEVLSNGKFVIE